MTIHIEAIPVLSIATGILVLVFPRLLNYIVAIYLILFGVLRMLQG